MQHVNDPEGRPDAADVPATLAGLLEACGDDPFVLVGSLVEFSDAMPAENRVLWPPALHSAVQLAREALRFCYCSIPIGLSAARLPKRLLRSPPRYRRRRF